MNPVLVVRAGLSYLPEAKKVTARPQRDTVVAVTDMAEQDLVDLLGEVA